MLAREHGASIGEMKGPRQRNLGSFPERGQGLIRGYPREISQIESDRKNRKFTKTSKFISILIRFFSTWSELPLLTPSLWVGQA